MKARIPLILMLFALFCRAKENGHRICAVGVLGANTAHFQRNRNAIKITGKQTFGRGKQSKSWSMSEPSISGKGKSKENQRETKGTKSENKGGKGSCKGKALELRQVDNDDRSWIHEEGSFDGSLTGGKMIGMVLNGVKIVNKQTHVTSASSFSEREKMNLDTRVAANALNFGPEGVGGGSFHDWLPDGEAWQFQGFDENGFPRSLDAYEGWNSSASASASAPASRVAGIACKEQQDFHVKHIGGKMIPTHSKFGQEMRVHSRNCLMNKEITRLPFALKRIRTISFFLN